MEKCCGSISDVTGGSTGAECEGFTQRTFKTGLYRARVIRVIAGIANNINQAVKLGNSQGKLYYSDIDKLQSSLDDVKKTFGEVLEVWRLQRS